MRHGSSGGDVAELGEICLRLNVKKAKVLNVAPLTATETQCAIIMRDMSSAGGFTARCDQCFGIIFVASVLDAGVRTCAATSEMRLVMLRKSGYQHQGAALADQLNQTSRVVGSHIDGIAALVGVDGYAAETNAFVNTSADLLRASRTMAPLTVPGRNCVPVGISGASRRRLLSGLSVRRRSAPCSHHG